MIACGPTADHDRRPVSSLDLPSVHTLGYFAEGICVLGGILHIPSMFSDRVCTNDLLMCAYWKKVGGWYARFCGFSCVPASIAWAVRTAGQQLTAVMQKTQAT